MPTDLQIARALFQRFNGMFVCQDCGKCCTEYSSIDNAGILVEMHDIDRLCDKLTLSRRKFKDTYTQIGPNDTRRRIVAPCPFHDDKGCSVYKYRPDICRSYPVRGYNTDTKQLVIDSKCTGVQKLLREGQLAKGDKPNVVRPSGELPPVQGIPEGTQDQPRPSEVSGETGRPSGVDEHKGDQSGHLVQ